MVLDLRDLRERLLIAPHRIFDPAVADLYRPVGGIALVGAMGAVLGPFEQIHAHVLARKIIDRAMTGLEHQARPDRVGDGRVLDEDAHAFRALLEGETVIGLADRFRQFHGFLLQLPYERLPA